MLGSEVAERDRRRARSPLRQRGPVAGLALLLGAALLWLALPKVVASTVLALRDPVIQQMNAGEPVSKTELLGLIASRELALSWVEDRESQRERGAALAELAFREEPRSVTERAMLEQAADALRAGLALAPAAPKDWMQLGYLLVLLDGSPHREAARVLLASVRTGPLQTPDFLRKRLFWCLAHWKFYDQQEREEIAEQIRLAWRVAPGELADLALYVPEFLAPISSALDQVPPARAQFLAALAFATPSP